jgi:hypothetical protein
LRKSRREIDMRGFERVTLNASKPPAADDGAASRV